MVHPNQEIYSEKKTLDYVFNPAECKPFKGRLNNGNRHYLVTVILTTVLVLAFNVPFWFQYKIIPDQRNLNGFDFQEAEFLESGWFKYFYSSIPEIIINHGIPVILLGCFAIPILRNVLRSQAHPEVGRVENKSTKISLVIIILTIIPNVWQVKTYNICQKGLRHFILFMLRSTNCLF